MSTATLQRELDLAAQTGIRDGVLHEIRELAEQHGLSRVILFGSRARGDFKRTSDIDLAVEGGNTNAFANLHDKHYHLFEQLKDKFEHETAAGAESASNNPAQELAK